MTRKMTKLAFGLSLLIMPVAAFAAEEGADKSLWDQILNGGWAMIPLGLMSIVMVYFIVQNGLAVREKVLLRPDLFPEFIKLMQQKKISEAYALCQQNKTLFTYVFGAGLERCSEKRDVNFEKVKEAIEEASTEEVTTYMKPIDYLSIIGATAPMLGLLGTVSGMIGAFNKLGVGNTKAADLAGNIGEALMTTATGLVIAIPAMLFYYYYRNSFIKSTATLGRNIGALLDTLETGDLPLGFEENK